jgi:hypothetical protein
LTRPPAAAAAATTSGPPGRHPWQSSTPQPPNPLLGCVPYAVAPAAHRRPGAGRPSPSPGKPGPDFSCRSQSRSNCYSSRLSLVLRSWP